jgi:hypothetical protein
MKVIPEHGGDQSRDRTGGERPPLGGAYRGKMRLAVLGSPTWSNWISLPSAL